MQRECINESLFEIWEGKCCCGNGGIITYPDGATYLVTARHVVYDGDSPRKVVLCTQQGKRLFNSKVTFQSVPDRDLAIMEAPHYLSGLPIASVITTQSWIRICGSLFGDLFRIPAQVVYAGAENNRIENTRKRRNIESSLAYTVRYLIRNPERKSFPGTSGSLIMDENNHVVGVHTETLYNRLAPMGMYNGGEVLCNTRIRS